MYQDLSLGGIGNRVDALLPFHHLITVIAVKLLKKMTDPSVPTILLTGNAPDLQEPTPTRSRDSDKNGQKNG